MRPHAPSVPDDPVKAAQAAYAIALRWLAGREMSRARVRERLLGRGFPESAADGAVQRLVQVGALDDRRAAMACARTLTLVKRRGRLRVQRELERLGFDRDTARDAVASALADHDERRFVEEAAAARVRHSRGPLDLAARRRIFGALLRQGFAPSLISDVLRQLKAGTDEPPAD